jgi:hypothetical protein
MNWASLVEAKMELTLTEATEPNGHKKTVSNHETAPGQQPEKTN